MAAPRTKQSPVTEPEPTETPDAPTPDVPAPEEDNRPEIVKFMERLGLKRGATLQHVWTTDGQKRYGPIEIVELAATQAFGDRLEVVITVREPGTKPLVRLRYEQIVSFQSV